MIEAYVGAHASRAMHVPLEVSGEAVLDITEKLSGNFLGGEGDPGQVSGG